MSLNFSELKGLSTYNFKKDKGVCVKIKLNTDDLYKIKDIYFMVCDESGKVLYLSKKGCFSLIEYKKTVRTGSLFFGRYTTVKAYRLGFKRNEAGYSESYDSFRNFCANRRSGSEIFDLFLQELSNVSDIYNRVSV